MSYSVCLDEAAISFSRNPLKAFREFRTLRSSINQACISYLLVEKQVPMLTSIARHIHARDLTYSYRQACHENNVNPFMPYSELPQRVASDVTSRMLDIARQASIIPVWPA